MKILAVGDVYGLPGLECIEKHLRSVRSAYGADMVIVNGENRSEEHTSELQSLG